MNFNPLPALTFLSLELGAMIWVWEYFTPVGSLFLIVGFMKVGKSWFLYMLAMAVVQGRSFLGFPTRKGAVLILALEEHARDIQLRLKRLGLRPEDPLYIHAGYLSYDSQTLQTLHNFIIEKQIVLVLFDTLSVFLSRTLVDENSNSEIVKNLSPLLDLSRSTNCAIGLVAHSSKAGGADGRSIRGASSLFAMVDQAIFLEHRQGGGPNQRVLRTLGRYAESPDELIIELQGNEYICLGSGAEAFKREQEALVLHALRQGPKTVEEVGRITDLSAKQARRSLEALLSQKKTKREGEGKKNDPFVYSLA